MKQKLILILLLLFIVVPAGTAFALPEEQVIDREISTGYYDIWKHSNGTWQITGRPSGWHMVFADPVFKADKIRELGEKWIITRIEATGEFDRDEYEAAGGWWGSGWDKYYEYYYRFRPKIQFTEPLVVKDSSESQAVEANGETIEVPLDDELRQAILTNFEGETIPVWIIKFFDKYELQEGGKAVNLIDPAKRQKYGLPPKTFSDNVEGWRVFLPALITWYGVPKEQKNLKVKITSIPSEYPNPGAYVKISGVLINESSSPITTVVRWTINGNTAFEGQVTVEDTRDLNFTFQMPDSDAVVAVEANPNRDMPPDEITFEDNKDSVTIKKNVLKPVLNDSLRLTARSVGGTDIYGNYVPSEQRPPGTAKFTDIVRAELTARGAPDLDPCYRLITWELDSATIEYPKRHPDFTFGSPVEPQGTVKKEMQITGARSAVVEFREDWSLNGAQIFDTLKGEMVPGPTYYDVKVTYTMHWEYEKGHLACCGEEDCDPCCKDYEYHEEYPTYTVKAKLLVNGTSVNSTAH